MIKFRAWDKESQIMFNIARFDFADYTVYSHLFACEGYVGEDLEIMQFTGLKDMNGVEIYIGDILEYEMIMGFGWYENGKDVVVYDEEELKIKMKKRTDYSLNQVVSVGCEVLGNIYQHPHLIEECLQYAYDEIKGRKGKTINGTFIKETDL